MKYRTIVADPPWAYDGFASSPDNPFPGRRVAGAASSAPILATGLPYPSMTVEAICDLPVREMADKDGAFLFLWTTNKYLPDAFDVVAAWGFRYRQALVWHKTGTPSPFGGAVSPNHAEYLLVGRRGGARLKGRLASNVVQAIRGAHSVKPDVFLDLVETVSPGPYLEMFARRARFGWDYWGDESLQTAEVAS